MGRFLNKGNRKFAELAASRYFVDKSKLINKLLEKDGTEKFICNSRARRFGKSVTADMLVAYFSKGADSRELFAPLKCEKNELFVGNMNQYDTIFMDIQAQFGAARQRNANPIQYVRQCVIKELQKEYPEIVSEDDTMAEALANIYNETENQFVIIFDEWDYPIRELDEGCQERTDYVEFLRGLFKNSDAKEYVRLAYMTGIMPVVRTKGQSAVNNFVEYTMTNPMDLAQRIAACEQEIQKGMIGQQEIIRQVMIAMLTGGNVLLEGMPGLGKTRLVSTIAKVFDLSFKRIQFTPDLMPSDVTGTNIMIKNERGSVFSFERGPVFANLVLADEINRATPKTQSALLCKAIVRKSCSRCRLSR